MDKKKWVLQEIYNLIEIQEFYEVNKKWEKVKEVEHRINVTMNYWEPWNVHNYVVGGVPPRRLNVKVLGYISLLKFEI